MTTVKILITIIIFFLLLTVAIDLSEYTYLGLEDTIKRLITEEKEVKEPKTYTEDELREIIKDVLNENK